MLKKVVLTKFKTTADRCETLLTESVIKAAFGLNKDARELYRQAAEDSDPSLIKILIKAYRSISRKYNYLTRPDHTNTRDDDIHGRPQPRQRRTSYRRRPQGENRYPRRESDNDRGSKRDYHMREYRSDYYPQHEN